MSLFNKIVVIMGVNLGIGYEVMFKLVVIGVCVLMVCCSMDKVEKVCSIILFQVLKGKIDILFVDVFELFFVEDFVKSFVE